MGKRLPRSPRSATSDRGPSNSRHFSDTPARAYQPLKQGEWHHNLGRCQQFPRDGSMHLARWARPPITRKITTIPGMVQDLKSQLADWVKSGDFTDCAETTYLQSSRTGLGPARASVPTKVEASGVAPARIWILAAQIDYVLGWIVRAVRENVAGSGRRVESAIWGMSSIQWMEFNPDSPPSLQTADEIAETPRSITGVTHAG